MHRVDWAAIQIADRVGVQPAAGEVDFLEDCLLCGRTTVVLAQAHLHHSTPGAHCLQSCLHSPYKQRISTVSSCQEQDVPEHCGVGSVQTDMHLLAAAAVSLAAWQQWYRCLNSLCLSWIEMCGSRVADTTAA